MEKMTILVVKSVTVPAGNAASRNNLPVSHYKVYFEVEYKMKFLSSSM